MPRPLEGLIVVELARLLPAPLIGMVLRDLGATVFKIEFLPRGDSLRGSLLFDLLNRGKYSLAIPPAELSALLAKLLPRAQVLLTNYRPATQRELGLLPEVLLKAYPHLVYVNLLGFSDGRPGHDLNFLAESGVLERLRPSPAHPPIVPGFLFGDILGGSASALIRLLALVYRQTRTGQGGYLPITMREEMLRWSVATAHLYQLNGGQLPPPGVDFLSGGMPAYRVYATADGRYIAVAALEEKFWEEFCQFLGRPDLIPYGRTLHDPYPHQEMEKIFAAASWAEWVERLKDTSFCVTPVYTFAEAIQAPWAEEIWQKGFLCFAPPEEELRVPDLGEHNAYLAGWLE
ncbi:MAG: CoA transferase [Bacteroidia bacterium]|nr:CoA transferase [Bacteroidia bacterium]MDW8089381.1 CaiB/BaiF CoA-transferase family protein [Bacteroidia bacterium]